MSKIVTLCGSMKFKKEMMRIATELEIKQKYVVIQCVYFDDDVKLSSEEVKTLSKLHFNKIDISDAIYVVNVNGYLGDATKVEIEYAINHQKEIMSLEPLKL